MKPRQPDAVIPALSGVNSRPVSGNMRFEVPHFFAHLSYLFSYPGKRFRILGSLRGYSKASSDDLRIAVP